jgi:hypothetical protein
MTALSTFALMRGLTPAEMSVLECRYDGPIPASAVRAIIDRRDAPQPTYSPATLDRMRRDLEFAAQQNRTMARQLIRSAKRCKAFGLNAPDAASRRRTREAVVRYLENIRDVRATASRLQAEAASISARLTGLMREAASLEADRQFLAHL